MSAHPDTLPSLELPHLRELLDEAETERTRLNRRIRRIRNLIKAVENGDEMPDLAELFGDLRPSPQSPPPPRLVLPAHTGPLGPATILGEGLPPGVPSPVAPPPPAGELRMPSVDVGRLGRMTPEALDALPFGVVTLDSTGRVIGYNDTESRLAGLPREAVLGRNFFGDVAPCAAVREFEGRFRDFAEGRSRLSLETFEFVFNFKRGAQRVVIMISPARLRGRFHVSMIRR
ncbi:MAG: PAS domain-containing protein [Deltaproteobacteria bacterium]|nr:MAG: PAS domain-containing protein [Deltaproteobacteria bacterium]